MTPHSRRAAIDSTDGAEWIFGPENHLSEYVASQIAKQESLSNPVTLFGPSGNGKTMLLSGLAAEFHGHAADASPAGKTILIAAVDFARRFADAVETNSLSDQRNVFRAAKCIAIDAIEKMGNKKSAQQELSLLIDECPRTTFILTMDESPISAPYLIPRLASRLNGGLVVPITLPSVEARRALLESFAADADCSVNDAVLNLLARDQACQTIFPTCTDLRHLVGRLKLVARNLRQPIDLAFAHRFLVTVRAAGQPSLAEITRHVGRQFQLKVDVIRGKRRQQHISQARSCAVYLARQMTEKTLQQIGDYFGGRDHTTVMHACKKVAQDQEQDDQLRQCIEQLADEIAAACRLSSKS